jgi:hypothetical protein
MKQLRTLLQPPPVVRDPHQRVITRPRPEAVIGRTEIPQRNSLLPYGGVLSFRSEAPIAPTSIQDLLACHEVIQ